MKKIVIASNHDKDNEGLIALLEVLFPECEITTIPGAGQCDEVSEEDPLSCLIKDFNGFDGVKGKIAEV